MLSAAQSGVAPGVRQGDGGVDRPRVPIWVFLGKMGCGGLNREITVLGVQSSWCIRPQAFFRRFFFFDRNTHFVVFSGGVERGLGGLTARSSWKIRQNKGWETRRLDLAGMTTPPAATLFWNQRYLYHPHFSNYSSKKYLLRAEGGAKWSYIL